MSEPRAGFEGDWPPKSRRQPPPRLSSQPIVGRGDGTVGQVILPLVVGSSRLHRGVRWMARVRPSFVLYLVALALLPFKWWSPLTHQQAGWTDVFMAAATAAWLIEALLGRRTVRLRAVHYALGAYLATVAASGLVASDRSAAGTNVLITAELVAIAVLTADFARFPSGRRAMCRVIYAVVLVTAIEAAIGLLLFYLGHQTSLADGSSVYFEPSTLYTRVAAGFFSAPLLGSFCIAASAMVALPDNGLSRRARVLGQLLLAALVLSTVSRAAISFAIASALREASRRGTARAQRVSIAVLIGGVTLLTLLTVLPLSLDPLRPPTTPAGINGRLADIESAPSVIAKHPLLGQGPGSLTAVWHGDPRRPHFTPLNVAATTGLPSLVALMALIVILWRRRSRPTNMAIWSGLLGLGLDGLVQDVDHFRHVWIMLGLADANRGPPEHDRNRGGPRPAPDDQRS